MTGDRDLEGMSIGGNRADRISVEKEPEVRETQHGYCTSYCTKDGGAGYAFTPYGDADGTDARRGRRLSMRTARTLRRIALVVMSVAICFAGGYIGAWLAMQNGAGSKSLSTEGIAPVIDPQSPKGNENGSAAGGYTASSEVVAAVSDSIVLLSTRTLSENLSGETILTATEEACGVIFHEGGYILTNARVVDGATEISVRLSDGDSYSASVVGYDMKTDLAVLKINAGEKSLQVVEFGCSSDLAAGEQVVLLGNPSGLGKLTFDGRVSAVDGPCEIPLVGGETMSLLPIVVSGAIGGSGAIFNMDGRLVGLVSTLEYRGGLAFAIPSDSMVTTVNELCLYGYVRGVVDHGLSLMDVAYENFAYCHYRYGISELGVYVVSSKYSDSLRNKDRIVAVDGMEVHTSEELKEIASRHSVGDTLLLTVCRGDEIFLTELTLRECIPAGVPVSGT